MKISFAVRAAIVGLGIGFITASSSPTGAVPRGPVLLGTPQARTPASSQLGSAYQVPPICRNPFVRPRLLNRFELRSVRVLAAQCAGTWARATAARRTAARPFAAAATWTESVSWAFTSGLDGANPLGPVIVDPNGALYGENSGCYVAACYNVDGFGLVFKLTPPAHGQTAWTETDIYGFPYPSTNPALGIAPAGGLVMDETGALYGTAQAGGNVTCEPTFYLSGGCGVVFKLTPPPRRQAAWTETVLYTFTNANGDGFSPNGALAIDEHGALYGTTEAGGNPNCSGIWGPGYGCGMVFKLAPPARGQTTWTESVIHAFTGTNGDGDETLSGVVLDENGNLYGTTVGGGVGGAGTVYELTPPARGQSTWTESVLYAFSGRLDGNSPYAGVTFDHGVLYGTTIAGGSNCPQYNGCGVAFQLTPPVRGQTGWTENVLYNFGAFDGDGVAPFGLMIGDGTLYGTTQYGGTSGFGTVFALAPPMPGRTAWTETVLDAFTGANTAGYPPASVTAGGRGVLFGSTVGGGLYGYGTVFELNKTH